MANFCLIPEQVNKFIQGLQSGDIDPEKLATMDSSEARRDYLAKFVGAENAKEVNALFESKLLLKNQQAGMIDWAEKTLGKTNPRMNDIVSKINKLDRVITGADKQSFLEDLASKKLGVDVKLEDAQKLQDMVKGVQEAKTNIDPTSPARSPDRFEYGIQKKLLNRYVQDLKDGENPYPKKTSTIGKILNDVVGSTKYLATSLDNSVFMGGQTIKNMYRGIVDAEMGDASTIKSWGGNVAKSFDLYAKEFGGKDAMLPVEADVISRPHSLSGEYKALGRASGLGVDTEEAFPKNPVTNKLNKIPVVGRLLKGSEAAYNGTVLRMRADLADQMIDKAKDAGIDTLNPEEMKGFGKFIGDMTGRGSIGKLEVLGKEINVALFSPKFLSSNIRTLLAPLDYGIAAARNAIDSSLGADPTFSTGRMMAKKVAAQSTLKIVTGIGQVMVIANLLHPGSVNFDPTSSDFGKVKIGDNKFDFSGKMGAIVTLAARYATGKYTTTTGKVHDIYNPKFGQENGLNVLEDFFTNRASPIGQVGIDFLRGSDYYGNKATIPHEVAKLVTPIPVQQYMQFRSASENAANTLGGMILDGLGLQAIEPNTAKK